MYDGSVWPGAGGAAGEALGTKKFSSCVMLGMSTPPGGGTSAEIRLS